MHRFWKCCTDFFTPKEGKLAWREAESSELNIKRLHQSSDQSGNPTTAGSHRVCSAPILHAAVAEPVYSRDVISQEEGTTGKEKRKLMVTLSNTWQSWKLIFITFGWRDNETNYYTPAGGPPVRNKTKKKTWQKLNLEMQSAPEQLLHLHLLTFAHFLTKLTYNEKSKYMLRNIFQCVSRNVYTAILQ